MKSLSRKPAEPDSRAYQTAHYTLPAHAPSALAEGDFFFKYPAGPGTVPEPRRMRQGKRTAQPDGSF